jgi:hypothetical protein
MLIDTRFDRYMAEFMEYKAEITPGDLGPKYFRPVPAFADSICDVHSEHPRVDHRLFMFG